ncbi:MAG: hypothetical protein HGA87_02970 [Desulfobulbaceae bacterium]|nr:hypothetical protein [Desulfobulbaceae bacterium]
MNKFADVVNKYNQYSLDGAGTPIKEIEALQFLWVNNPSFDDPSESVDSMKKLVVVVVEDRLLNDINSSKYSKQDLLTRLLTFKYDLSREGYQTKFVKMQPYPGPVHQDGKTLLAIREFFKSVRDSFSNLEGAILVGSFPEASIVRTLPQGTDEFPGEYRVGGPIGNFTPRRFELVLSDLDGNWLQIYYPLVNIISYRFVITPSTTVSQNGTKVILVNSQVIQDVHVMQDVFWIKDESVQINGSTVVIDMKCSDPEVSATDKIQPNPVARPNISVSRINPRNIAVQPPNARYALDANGKPQRTTQPVDYNYESWTQDANLERTLLIDYFDRNHAFRSGKYSQLPMKISVVESANLGTADAEEGLQGLSFPRDNSINGATLLDFIKWMKYPVLFRVFSAHAGCRSTQLITESDSDAALAENEAGGHPWRWISESGYYVPSFKGHATADLFVFRTLWENKILASVAPSLMMHIGCSVNNVSHPELLYNQPTYGTFQNAECILFYGNQLAVLCHATDWNIGPLGFGTAFSPDKAVMGTGLKGVSEVTSQDAGLAAHSTQRKENYIWSLLGDWTLQKYYPSLCFREVAVNSNQDGRLEVFYIGVDDKIYHRAQTAPNSGWGIEVPLGGSAKQIAVASNQDGRLEVFYVGTNTALFHNWQVKPNGLWNGESFFVGNAKQIVMGRNLDGRLEVFYIGVDDKIYHRAQTAPNSGWGNEVPLGGSAKQIAVASNQDGRLEVFYVGTNSELFHNWQVKPNGSWHGESFFGGNAKQIVTGRNVDGRLEVFYIGVDDKIYHRAQTAPNSGWGNEAPLGGSAKQIAVASNQDGRLEVFYVGTNTALFHNWQVKPNGSWYGESFFGGNAKQIVMGRNLDGRLEVFYIGVDDKIYNRAQTAPNRGWDNESILQ